LRLTRIYVAAPLAAQTSAQVDGTAAGHITRVLRLRPGDAVTAFDGSGAEFEARLQSVTRAGAMLEIGARTEVQRESALTITLVQGVSRGERMDWVVQKATELGVTHIVPVFTARSVVRLGADQAESRRRHWLAIAIAACEQCGRNRLPSLAAPLALIEWLRSAVPAGGRFVLSPHGPLRVRDLAPMPALTVLIGPEGGLADEEEMAAKAAGFEPLRLGPRILRTETAAVAALAALQQQLGDL